MWVSSPVPWHGAWHLLVAAVLAAALRRRRAGFRPFRRFALLAVMLLLVMARIAIEAGVPAEAVLIDRGGVDTRRSAEGCRRVMVREGLSTALVVSHYYHLARCRMAFALSGIQCHTVPARMSRRLAREPYFVLRECAGFLAYLLPRRA